MGKMESSRISAVVFDMDGVLFDTERLTLIVWKQIAKRHGLENIEEVYHKAIGRTTEETKLLVHEAYLGLDVDALYSELRKLMRSTIAEQGLPIKPYSREILEALREKKIPLALASSTRYETVKAQLGMTGYIDYFDVVIGGDMAEHSKPAPDIYIKACEKLGIAPDKAAAVEDSFNGIRSASVAGLYTVMVPDILQPDDELLKLVDAKCTDLNEAKEHLLGIL